MNKEQRKINIAEIRANENNVAMTGIPLTYRGTKRIEKVYRIPLKYLIYNKYNGRIGAEVKSYERQNHVLNLENEYDTKIVEKFLYESKTDRNDKTMGSLLNQGQQRYGIITADGIIVDGNRRAFLLNKLFNERDKLGLEFSKVEPCQYFLAIILPDDAEEKDIQQLETIYQMGEDDKLDYNPIEKYLKCSDLIKCNFSITDIADFMKENESTIKTWLEILKLMEEYLEEYGYSGIYTRLEKTEGPFVDLVNYLSAYNKRSKNAITDWIYEDSDISDLKLICFDYIRARYEGKEFREIAKTGKESSIFANKDVWDSFLEEHKRNIPQDEFTAQEIKENNPNGDLTQLYRSRDLDWTNKAKGNLEGNLKKHTRKIEDKRDSDKPLALLEKALGALMAVDTDQKSFYENGKVLDYVKEINALTWEYKKLLEKGKK